MKRKYLTFFPLTLHTSEIINPRKKNEKLTVLTFLVKKNCRFIQAIKKEKKRKNCQVKIHLDPDG